MRYRVTSAKQVSGGFFAAAGYVVRVEATTDCGRVTGMGRAVSEDHAEQKAVKDMGFNYTALVAECLRRGHHRKHRTLE